MKKRTLLKIIGILGSTASIIGILIYIPTIFSSDSDRKVKIYNGNNSPIVSGNSGDVTIDYITNNYTSNSNLHERLVVDQVLGLPKENVIYKDDYEFGNMKTTITAKIGSEDYLIVDNEESCLKIISQQDFDGNGSIDALVMNIVACGGNCCANNFFFISYTGNGHFQRTDDFGNSWDEPIFDKWQGFISVSFLEKNEGFNQQDYDEEFDRYILYLGKAILIEESRSQKIITIVEISSSEFNYDDFDEIKNLNYDLNSDGINDVIKCKLWHRWGRIMFTVNMSGIGIIDSNIACKRIGVLDSKTNGVSNLVCDNDKVLRFISNEYK